MKTAGAVVELEARAPGDASQIDGVRQAVVKKGVDLVFRLEPRVGRRGAPEALVG